MSRKHRTRSSSTRRRAIVRHFHRRPLIEFLEPRILLTATVTYTLVIGQNDGGATGQPGYWTLYADDSVGDNYGIASLGVEIANVTSTSNDLPAATYFRATGVRHTAGAGFTFMRAELPTLAGVALTGTQDICRITSASLDVIEGLGQVGGDLTVLPVGFDTLLDVTQPVYAAHLQVAHGTYDPSGLLPALEPSMNWTCAGVLVDDVSGLVTEQVSTMRAAVHLVATSTVDGPSILVTDAGQPLSDGGCVTLPGQVALGGSLSHEYTLTNTGNAPLDLTGGVSVQNLDARIVGGPYEDASAFVAAFAPGITSLAPGQSTTLVVTFTPTVIGQRAAGIVLQTAAQGATQFAFQILGSGVSAPVPAPPPAASVPAPTNPPPITPPVALPAPTPPVELPPPVPTPLPPPSGYAPPPANLAPPVDTTPPVDPPTAIAPAGGTAPVDPTPTPPVGTVPPDNTSVALTPADIILALGSLHPPQPVDVAPPDQTPPAPVDTAPLDPEPEPTVHTTPPSGTPIPIPPVVSPINPIAALPVNWTPIDAQPVYVLAPVAVFHGGAIPIVGGATSAGAPSSAYPAQPAALGHRPLTTLTLPSSVIALAFTSRTALTANPAPALTDMAKARSIARRGPFTVQLSVPTYGPAPLMIPPAAALFFTPYLTSRIAGDATTNARPAVALLTASTVLARSDLTT